MGIRVSCPNGHSLNIKSFLAGKVGVCPKCEAKFRIPTEAALAAEGGVRETAPQGRGPLLPTPFTPKPQASPGQATAAESSFDDALDDLLGETIDLGRGAPTGGGRLSVAAPIAARPSVAVNRTAASAVSGPPTTAATGTVGAVRPPSTPEDPVEGAPSIWFVRPPSGGQYGPADEATVHQWLTEGRINGPTLVWRAGWEDWRRADDVFDSLRRAAAGNILVKAPGNTQPRLSALQPLEQPQSPVSPRRKRGKGGGVLLVGFLAVISLVLVAALIMVLM